MPESWYTLAGIRNQCRFGDQIDYRVQDKTYVSYRSLHNHILLIIKQRTQLINELKQLLYSVIPEILCFCTQGVPDTIQEVLIRYPSAQKLSNAQIENLLSIKGVTLDKAQKLISLAQNSIGSRNSPTEEYVVKELAEEIQLKSQRIEKAKKFLQDNCQGPETALLQTVKGIGAYSAAVLMIHIVDVTRFASPKKMGAFFGVVPTITESGDKKSHSRMSKKGSGAVRGILYMCAITAVQYDPHMKAIFDRLREAGMSYGAAIGVIMHKMLRICWGLLNSQTAYNPQIDQTNQQRSVSKKEDTTEKEIEAKRRLQPFDPTAPVSRTAGRKRKAHTASQAGHNAESMRDLAYEPLVSKVDI
jgi:transposase